MKNTPTLQSILLANKRIAPFIIKTPVYTSKQLDELCNCSVFLKCENFQRTGAFKMRGAINAVLSLVSDKTRGVATHSSGNHAAALALAAKIFKIPAFVVMPENAPSVKRNAVISYGAEIIPCEPNMESREVVLSEVIERTGAAAIPSYNDNRIIEGQGTAILEMLADHDDLDMVISPVGGGGLISGTAIVSKSINSKINVLGVEPELANDAKRSMQAGKIIPSVYPDTIADGLRTSLGDLTFPIIQKYVDDIKTVTEQEIIGAMYFIWERLKIIIEPSSAVPVAALMYHDIKQKDKKVGIILSGGNVNLQHLPWGAK